MSERTLLNGEPVPEDGSHREIDPATGMQKGYVVLSEAERAKGFVKPVRQTYVHNTCHGVTTMGIELAQTYARDPSFYTGTYCVKCKAHFPLAEFAWMVDSEPMDPSAQPAWAAKRAAERELDRLARIQQLEAELAKLKAQAPPPRSE